MGREVSNGPLGEQQPRNPGPAQTFDNWIEARPLHLAAGVFAFAAPLPASIVTIQSAPDSYRMALALAGWSVGAMCAAGLSLIFDKNASVRSGIITLTAGALIGGVGAGVVGGNAIKRVLEEEQVVALQKYGGLPVARRSETISVEAGQLCPGTEKVRLADGKSYALVGTRAQPRGLVDCSRP